MFKRILLVVFLFIGISGSAQNVALDSLNIDQYFNQELSDSLRTLYNNKLHHMNAYIKVDSLNASAFLERGICYTLLGMHAKSIFDYNKAIDLDSTLSAAYFNRGLAKGNYLYSLDACTDIKKSFELGVENAQMVLLQQCRRYHQVLGLKK